MNRKTVVGMSGGVDSSVVAWLLKEQGYDIIDVTMQIWQDEDTKVQEAEGGRYGLGAADSARRVVMDLGIPYYVMNLKGEFRKNVVDCFADEYVERRVPNPCIACNRHAEWESLLKRSIAIGMDYIATGRYARIDNLPGGRYSLKTSMATVKDQTYVLYSLAQGQLPYTLVPVGNYHKEEIRDMAECLGFSVAHEPDSQEIYFILDHDYTLFIEEYTGRELPPRNFVDLGGNILGHHRGITHCMVGQGKGLNPSMGRPVFVVEIYPETNEVIIGDNQDVSTSVFRCDKLNWMAVGGFHGESMDALAEIRYSRKGSLCTIREIRYDVVECHFHESARAMTPRQAAIFYDGGYVAGGGTIVR